MSGSAPCDILTKALREGLAAGHEAEALAQSALARLEARGFRVVPADPTRAMVSASMHALDFRAPGEGWIVSTRAKHRLRLMAALGAAPDWRAAP